jgi:hypothetical protein
MIRAGRVGFELPQILELMEVGHGFVVPLLGFLDGKLRGAAVHCDLAAQPEIGAAGYVDRAYGKIRIRRGELVRARLERLGAAELAKIGLRGIQNILETPACPVLLVLTLSECGSSEKTGKKKRNEARNFYVHDVPALEMRQGCAASKDRAGSAPAATSAYSNRLQLRTNYPAVGKQTDGIKPRRVAHPFHGNRLSARLRSPSSFELSNALSNNPEYRQLLRGILLAT